MFGVKFIGGAGAFVALGAAIYWRALVAEADAEAHRLGHSFLAPEHLLFAVAQHGRGASQAFFDRYGLTPDVLRESVVTLLGPMRERAAADGPQLAELDVGESA